MRLYSIIRTPAMKHIFFSIYFLITTATSLAQHLPSLGNPNIQNYSKSQYKAGNQNWGMAQGKDGVIYTANNDGLLLFDGSYWEIYPLTNRKYVRSVAIAPNDDIYIGGKEEFGYFRKVNGKLIYKKLSSLVDPTKLENDEIWKILFVRDKVIFQSFSKLYVYHNNKIDIQYGQGEPFLFAHQINDQLWIEKIPTGLQNWSNNNFQALENKLTNVLTILPFQRDSFLVGTAKQGLFLLSNKGKIEKWEPNSLLEKSLKEAQINNGLKIADNLFAFGTIKNGIFIIDNQGNIIQHIHKRNGLQNNTVLSMILDQQGNIWAGLDNGIDRIEINSPFYYYKDIFGELGTVYAIKIFDNKIYLGTNQGLFYSHWTNDNNSKSINLHFIKGSQGQVWSLDIINNQLICGHNDGTFIVSNDLIHKISPWTGGWINKQTSTNSPIFIQGNYTGLAIFEDINNNWRLKKKFDKPKTAILDIIKKDNAHYWLITNSDIQLIQFEANFQSFKNIKTFTFQTDFPNIQRISPRVVEDNTLFVSDKGIFLYDNVLSKFKPYDELNKTLGSYSKSTRIYNINSNTYIFANAGKFAQVNFHKGNIKIDSTSFNNLENIIMKNHEIIEPFEQKLIFGLDNGIAIYDNTTYKPQKITKPIIKGFQYITSTIDSIHPINTKTVIPNSNSIRILFSSAWFSSNHVKYQYFLEGYTKEWSYPSETPYVDFTNLNWGKYTFKVKAVTNTGESSEITTVKFRIAAPWYLTWKAIAIYIVILSLFIYYTRKIVLLKIKRDKHKISEKIKIQQEEILRKETEQNEKKLMALKNEQLSQELELKRRELANAATNILYKNELLNNLHEELLNLKDKEGKKLSNEQLQKVNILINNARSDERDWDIFEKSFNESHENFFKKLKVYYPTLSPNDLKLCAYLRLNMSSKDIASLVNISTRGIEIRRYRLRKKFNLPTDKNLNEFLMEL